MPSDTPEGPRTIPRLFGEIVASHPDREALVGDGVRLTYAEFDRASRDLAATLIASGVTKYTRVAIHAPNCPAWVVAFLATTRIGAIPVPLSTFSSGPELVRSLRHADCHSLVVRPGPRGDGASHLAQEIAEATPDRLILASEVPFLRSVMRLEADGRAVAERGSVPDEVIAEMESEVHADDPAMMIYTSGSTSAPKGVLHSHAAVVAQTGNLVLDLGFTDAARNLTTLPFFWVGGFALALLPTLAVGGTMCTVTGFDPAEILALVEQERLTRIAVFPQPNVEAVLSHPDLATRDLASIERGVAGFPPGRDGEPTVSDPIDGLMMGLGMSETLSCYWWGQPDETDVHTPPLHRTAPDVEVKVVDENGDQVNDGDRGEILVRGPIVTIGLHKVDRDETFDPDGYYRTGDLGVVDGDSIRFRGRSGDVIRTSGANVAAAEVVRALLGIPGVASAHVVGIADERRGEVVGAAVVPEAGVDLEVDTVLSQLRDELARYKVPAALVICSPDQIPLTATSKIDQRRLRDLVVAGRRETA